jgi:hypothetical protein
LQAATINAGVERDAADSNSAVVVAKARVAAHVVEAQLAIVAVVVGDADLGGSAQAVNTNARATLLVERALGEAAHALDAGAA